MKEHRDRLTFRRLSSRKAS